MAVDGAALGRIAEDLSLKPVVLPDGEEVNLTFSAGICSWQYGDDVSGLMSKVDEALYRAKVEGGDTVVHLG